MRLLNLLRKIKLFLWLQETFSQVNKYILIMDFNTGNFSSKSTCFISNSNNKNSNDILILLKLTKIIKTAIFPK